MYELLENMIREDEWNYSIDEEFQKVVDKFKVANAFVISFEY
jgi:hypothetical protein